MDRMKNIFYPVHPTIFVIFFCPVQSYKPGTEVTNSFGR